jgi:UDP:flavonoid glycosyltransferase YjiC (YdhE family)
LHDTYELPTNMWGAQQVPQTTVLPHVDLVITHGGNNTTTESFHFGKPMVLLPLVLGTSTTTRSESTRRDTEFAGDLRLRGRRVDRRGRSLARRRGVAHANGANAAVIRSRDGTTRAADLIEAVAR